MIVVAQVSDLHIDGGERADRRAAEVFAYIETLSDVDAVVVTGDLADHGDPAEYQRVRELFASRHPLISCPGNHDKRADYRKVLLDLPASDVPVNTVLGTGSALYASCDSTIPGRDDGFLAGETLAWLDSVLSGTEPAKPAFVCFHHPPVELGIPYIDRIRQHGEERLAELLARHPRVVALLCGHAHTPASTTFAGLPLLVAPGVVSTSLLPADGRPPSKSLPPGFLLHVLHDDYRLTTHTRVVPGQEGDDTAFSRDTA